MSYLSDWAEAERGAGEARKAHPYCTGGDDCPADNGGHLAGCRRWRRVVWPAVRAGRIPHPRTGRVAVIGTAAPPFTDWDVLK